VKAVECLGGEAGLDLPMTWRRDLLTVFYLFLKSDFAMNGIHSMADENVLRLYDSIREQVSADIRLGARHRLLGEAAQQQADRLREELDRRGLQYTPIVWGIARV